MCNFFSWCSTPVQEAEMSPPPPSIFVNGNKAPLPSPSPELSYSRKKTAKVVDETFSRQEPNRLMTVNIKKTTDRVYLPADPKSSLGAVSSSHHVQHIQIAVSESPSYTPLRVVIHPSPTTPSEPLDGESSAKPRLIRSRSDEAEVNERRLRMIDEQRDNRFHQDLIKCQQERAQEALVFGFLAHEIRGLVTSIIAAKDEPEPSEIRKLPPSIRAAWDAMAVSSDELLHFLNNSLDLTKISQGEMQLNPVQFSFSEFIHNIGLQFNSKLHSKNLQFKIECADNIPLHLIGDRHRLNQVLSNLLSNAIKFTEAGSITLQVNLVATSDNNATLRFAVTDTGKGLSINTIASLCQPFKQANSSVAGQHGGTGLGLYICKLLIQLMNGLPYSQEAANAISITSDGEGTGSTFAFLSTFKTPENVSVVPVKPPKAQFLPNLRILCVDDELVNRKIMHRMLLGMKCEVDVKDSAQAALDTMFPPEGSSPVYDAVLLDVNMKGGMNGIEAARHIRQRSRSMGITPPMIVACSGNILKGSDCEDFNIALVKPTSKTTIFDVLAPLVEAKTQAHAKTKTKEE